MIRSPYFAPALLLLPVAGETLHSRFEAIARAWPDRPAVSDGSQRMRYVDLDASANRVAHALLQCGANLEAPVAVVLGSGASYLSAVLGVLKAGGFFASLDPRHPEARNAQITVDMGPGSVVTDSAHRAHAEAVAPGLPLLDLDDLPRNLPASKPTVAATADTLAAIVYTSGSTGSPKGVVYDHRALLHNARTYATAFGVTPADRVSLLFPVNVYATLRDLSVALLSGATSCVYDLGRKGLAPLGEWIEREGVTVLCSNVTVFRHAVRDLGERHVQTVRLVKVGGEQSYWSDVARFRSVFPAACQFYCGFGASETTGLCHLFVEPDTPLGRGALPMGVPIDGIEIAVVDPSGAPVPAGEVGEISVRSRYIARGYWGHNDGVFTTDPEDPAVRRFATGDLGRLLPDGRLVHHGRKDDRVKISGHRVSLWEVEQDLLDLDAVAEGVVVEAGGPRLVAHVALEPGRPAGRSLLRDALARRLPAHMIPSAFVVHDVLPRLPSGKIDRVRLADVGAGPSQVPYETPVGPVEHRLAEIWQEVLGTETIGRRDHFSEVGGDSLRAMQVAAAVEREWAVSVPIRALFESPTVAGLAAHIGCHVGGRMAALNAALAALPADEARLLLDEMDVFNASAPSEPTP